MGKSVMNIGWDRVALLVGLVIGLAFLIAPVTISILGSEMSCGPSAIASLGLLPGSGNGLEAGLARQCGIQGISRSVIGILFAAGGVLGFLILQGRIHAMSPASSSALIVQLRKLHSPRQRVDGGTYECSTCASSWPCRTGQVLGAEPM